MDKDVIKYNPFRYKGYYLDIETNLYYCNARYYDPSLYMWLSRDSIEYLDSTSVNGINLYCYCNNNPVMNIDPSGQFFIGLLFQIAVSVISFIAIAIISLFDEEIKKDMDAIGWNISNTDEEAVINSSKVSFYKGVPVIQISEMGGSMSLGLIFFDKSQGVEVLKHERGHNTQLMSMGLTNYFIQIGIPSMWKNGDETPWELSASMLGDSALASEYSKQQKRKAINYYFRACVPIVNIYNIFQYIFY